MRPDDMNNEVRGKTEHLMMDVTRPGYRGHVYPGLLTGTADHSLWEFECQGCSYPEMRLYDF